MEPRFPPPIRPARPDDLEELLAMQLRSLRDLAGPCYDEDLLEAALAEMGTMDPRMIAQGAYLVAEEHGRIIGGAGWTMRQPSYAALLREPLPDQDGRTGIIRSVHVDPPCYGRGVARALIRVAEAMLRHAGATRVETLVALPCVPAYAAMGYGAVADHALLLAGRMEFTLRRMGRDLPVMAPSFAAAPDRPAAAPG
ncbi:GNAT family N-acetyltransferase [Falsiroseomonas sp. HW251]|uniref:GNAT family N-acetyltransferase n=1 Tax=Falsiroseomonas sp. HW251 TaxID=3390998 RepID=UPI003D3245F7